MPSQEFHGVERFALLADVSEGTVRRWVKQGDIVSYQPAGKHGRILIPSDALERTRRSSVDDSSILNKSPEPIPPPTLPPTMPDGHVSGHHALPGRAPKWTRMCAGPGGSNNK